MRFRLTIDAYLQAEDAGHAAQQIAEHFVWLANQWDADEALSEPKVFFPPSKIALEPE